MRYIGSKSLEKREENYGNKRLDITEDLEWKRACPATRGYWEIVLVAD
jgi:hypothetical protein